jgi:hypothetical protein
MIVGFGKTELEIAPKIIKECYQAIKDSGDLSAYEKIAKKYMSESEYYKSLDRDKAPERYSYFWCHHYKIWDLEDCKKTLFEFTFHHINRWHAFSPDGWAMLKTEWCMIVENDEFKIYKEQ